MRVSMLMLVSWVMSSSGCLKAPYIHCLELPDIEHCAQCNAELLMLSLTVKLHLKISDEIAGHWTLLTTSSGDM